MSRFTRAIALAVGLLFMGTGVASAGLVIGSGITLGYGPNGFTQLATNTVNHSFANSIVAPNQFAIFETHNPWGATVVKDAITGTGRTFTVFTPAQLAGFPFNTYRVVVLNWDDHFLSDFIAPYTAALPALESYVMGGGVLWIQGSIQGSGGDSYPLPFGGTMTHDLQSQNFIVNPGSPMVTGIPSPINGNFASHASAGTPLPGNANVVVRAGSAGGPPSLYDLVAVPVELQTFTIE